MTSNLEKPDHSCGQVHGPAHERSSALVSQCRGLEGRKRDDQIWDRNGLVTPLHANILMVGTWGAVPP